MKNNISRKTLLGVALLGTFVAAPFAGSVAKADPPANAPAYGRRAKDKNNKRRDDRREERRDDRRESYDRGRYDNDRDYRDRYDRSNTRSNVNYTGTVTNVRSGNSFDLSAGGRTYNVYTASSLPRNLSRGDQVSVSGERYGDNDVRRSNVSVLSDNRNDPRRDDRYGNNRPDYTRDRNGTPRYDPNGKLGGYGNGNRNDDYNNRGSLNTYIGTVTNVKNSREFDVRIGGRTYNVYANSSARDINRGDEVRITGNRFGDNDIRDARVILTRGDRNNGNDYGPYRNYNGVVTNVRSSREFDVQVGGRTYNVYTDSTTRDINRGDEVRVYGRGFGVNDIRNARAVITRNR